MTACSNCGSTRTHSDRVGCCTGCRRLFVGIRAFDRHRSWTSGEGRCLDPATATTANGGPIFEADDTGHGTPAYRLSRTDAERQRLAARLDVLGHPGVALEAHPRAEGSPNYPTTSPGASVAGPGMESGPLAGLSRADLRAAPAGAVVTATVSGRPVVFTKAGDGAWRSALSGAKASESNLARWNPVAVTPAEGLGAAA